MEDYDPKYEFDAPRLFDFSSMQDDHDETWFEVEHEEPSAERAAPRRLLDDESFSESEKSISTDVSVTCDNETERLIQEHNEKIKAKTPMKKSTTPKQQTTDISAIEISLSPRPVVERKEPLIKKRDVKISHDLHETVLEQKAIDTTQHKPEIKRKLTVPKSPKFATSRRTAMKPVESTEEKQLKEIELSRALKEKLRQQQKAKVRPKSAVEKPTTATSKSTTADAKATINTNGKRVVSSRYLDFVNKKPKTETVKKPSTAPPAPRGVKTTNVPVKKPVRTVSTARPTRPVVQPTKPKTTTVAPKIEKKEPNTLTQQPNKLKLTIPQPFSFVDRPREVKKAETSRVQVGLKKSSLREQSGVHKKSPKSKTLKEEEKQHKFKALQLDESILHGPPKGIPFILPSKLTTPMSPMLSTKLRSQVKPVAEITNQVQQTNQKTSVKAKTLTAITKSTELTEPVPFSFKTEERKKFHSTRQEPDTYSQFLANVAYIANENVDPQEKPLNKSLHSVKSHPKLTSPHSPKLHTKNRKNFSLRDL